MVEDFKKKFFQLFVEVLMRILNIYKQIFNDIQSPSYNDLNEDLPKKRKKHTSVLIIKFFYFFYLANVLNRILKKNYFRHFILLKN